MREPTPHAALYAWHTNALLGILGEEMPPTSEPQCGFYKRRLVEDGPYVPARIWMHQPVDEAGELIADETLQAEVDGRYVDPEEAWSWLCNNPISEVDFKLLMATRQWSEDYAPHEPYANPRQPVDWLKVPPPVFNKEPTP